MLKNKIKLLSVFSLFVFVGCTSSPKVTYVNPNTSKPMSLALEYKDFKSAATTLVEDLLKSGILDHPHGGRYVVAVATIKNDTTQNIDVDQLLSDIKISLLRSGKVVISAAVSTTDREKMLYEIRKLRGNEEFNQQTLPGKGQLIAPDFLLSGKIIQRTYYLGDQKKVEYYFILKLIDTRTGLVVWEGKKIIGKLGDKNVATW